MANIKQQIEFSLNKDFAEAMKLIDYNQLSKKLQKFIIQLVIFRINQGYDIHSRKFGGYNASYNKAKAYKYATSKFGKTEYASSSTNNKLRLTGNLLSGLKIQELSHFVNQNTAKIKLRMYLEGAENQDKAEGLMSTTGTARNRQTYSKKSYEFFGLAVSGSFKVDETKKITAFIQHEIKNALNGKLRIKLKNNF